jgi:hypothetical protein
MNTRPEVIPAALVALVIIAAAVLAALGVDVPAFLPYLGTAGAGAVFGVTQQPTPPAAPPYTAAPAAPFYAAPAAPANVTAVASVP